MRVEHDNLQRALRVFDPLDEGLVLCEQFHSAVAQFVMPLSNYLYSQLMAKFASFTFLPDFSVDYDFVLGKIFATCLGFLFINNFTYMDPLWPYIGQLRID